MAFFILGLYESLPSPIGIGSMGGGEGAWALQSQMAYLLPHHWRMKTPYFFPLWKCQKSAVVILKICPIYCTKLHIRTLQFSKISQREGFHLRLPQDGSLRQSSTPSPVRTASLCPFQHLLSSSLLWWIYLQIRWAVLHWYYYRKFRNWKLFYKVLHICVRQFSL